MNFLKKFGSIVLKLTEIVAGVAPTVVKDFPGASGVVQIISKDLAEIGNVIGQVEVIGQVLGTVGADKLKAAVPLVTQVILSSSLMAGKKIADPAKFQAAVSEITSAVADLLNSLEGSITSANP